MKLLLDEQVPARLSRSFPERFEVQPLVPSVIRLIDTSPGPGFYRIDA